MKGYPMPTHRARLSPSFLTAAILAASAAHAAPAAEPARAPASKSTGLFAIGPRFGTTGLGADLAFPLGDYFRVRLVGSVGYFSFDGDASDVEYAIDVSTPTLGGVMDCHPGGGAFRFSLGAFWSGIDADGSARPTDNVSIGDISYSPGSIGKLNATLEYPSAMGYLGIGFGNSFVDSRWTVSLDLGVLIGASPDFTLDSEGGLLSNDPAFRAELKKEEQEIRDDITDRLNIYPVLTLGLSFRF